MPPLHITPPLLNSANPWATTLEDLRALYSCSYTGAVTIRTSTLDGFNHDPRIHQYMFFDVHEHVTSPDIANPGPRDSGSLNTLGYSPIPLATYLEYIHIISQESGPNRQVDDNEAMTISTRKPFIVSVTGNPHQVRECWSRISTLQQVVCMPLAMEINLSCPNIPNKPPPAYSGEALEEYLAELEKPSQFPGSQIAVGIKTPPYTYAGQFDVLIGALFKAAKASPTGKSPIDFITATNTLGNSLVLTPYSTREDGPCELPALHSSDGTGVGGLAGAPLHPLALGNVLTLREKLDEHPELGVIQVIGVGGVSDNDGFWRMKSVGAFAVGVGTALGRKGIGIFEEITKGGVHSSKK